MRSKQMTSTSDQNLGRSAENVSDDVFVIDETKLGALGWCAHDWSDRWSSSMVLAMVG